METADLPKGEELFQVTDLWRQAYPGAHAGFLAMDNVENPDQHPGLEGRKQALEANLRQRYREMDRSALQTLPVIQAYTAYYRRFNKTYHVLLQLESIAQKNRSIPNVAALVEAMFIAELNGLLLTAGHDRATLEHPVNLSVARGDETYTLLNGQETRLKEGDMFMADRQGIISSILYGPDGRTRIVSGTRQVLFAVYAPPGIPFDDVYHHLEDIRSNVMLVSPQAQVVALQVTGA
jgi:DNA/RNA-binding domain of Phe-tRNA-synthetase-like protein